MPDAKDMSLRELRPGEGWSRGESFLVGFCFSLSSLFSFHYLIASNFPF
jgi:hypothetical protein